MEGKRPWNRILIDPIGSQCLSMEKRGKSRDLNKPFVASRPTILTRRATYCFRLRSSFPYRVSHSYKREYPWTGALREREYRVTSIRESTVSDRANSIYRIPPDKEYSPLIASLFINWRNFHRSGRRFEIACARWIAWKYGFRLDEWNVKRDSVFNTISIFCPFNLTVCTSGEKIRM